jgi:hypothetical protein
MLYAVADSQIMTLYWNLEVPTLRAHAMHTFKWHHLHEIYYFHEVRRISSPFHSLVIKE